MIAFYMFPVRCVALCAPHWSVIIFSHTHHHIHRYVSATARAALPARRPGARFTFHFYSKYNKKGCYVRVCMCTVLVGCVKVVFCASPRVIHRAPPSSPAAPPADRFAFFGSKKQKKLLCHNKCVCASLCLCVVYKYKF